MTNRYLLTCLLLSFGAHAALLVMWPPPKLTPVTPVEISFIQLSSPSPVAVKSEESKPATRKMTTAPKSNPVEPSPVKQKLAPTPEPPSLEQILKKPEPLLPAEAEEVPKSVEGAAPQLLPAEVERAAPRSKIKEHVVVSPAGQAATTVIAVGDGYAGPLVGDSVSATGKADSSFVAAAPAYAKNPPPPYPRMARKRGLEGDVVLLVLVSDLGKVLNVEVESSSGHQVLDRAALQSVRKWRFHPASREGVCLQAEVRVPVRFRLVSG